MATEAKELDIILPEELCLPVRFDLVANSKAYGDYCQIKANNDLEAAIVWLQRHSNTNTYRAYKREAERLLLWCCYEQGLSFNELTLQDIEQYFKFLSHPNKKLLSSPLEGPAKAFAKRAINSLFNFLVVANYLRFNPLKLLKKNNKLIDFTEHKYKVWERMLEIDEWQAVQQALGNMPETTRAEIDNKMRTQFLFSLLYFLGLRINEVATHTWSSFRKREDQWWFFVKGKCNKLGHIPVNEQLLAYIKNYRLHLGKAMLPKTKDTDPLLISTTTNRPLKVGQLYNLVKAIANMAASYFPEDVAKQKKLKKFSPHWLRHLSASHQDKAGVPASIIQANHRHSSFQTTQVYVHAEEARRFTEIQKLSMKLQSKLLVPKTRANTLEISMQLSKGPINKLMGLQKLIRGLETQILTDISWNRISPTKEALLTLTEQQLLSNNIELIYQLYGSEVLDHQEVWERAFIRQSDVWLFTAKVNSKAIEVSNAAG